MENLTIHEKMREILPNELCDIVYSYIGLSDTAKLIKENFFIENHNKSIEQANEQIRFLIEHGCLETEYPIPYIVESLLFYEKLTTHILMHNAHCRRERKSKIKCIINGCTIGIN
jgi:hypothetical protein